MDEERTITVTLKKAKEWYNSDNAILKELALQAFDEKELNVFDFTKIKTFNDALLCICKFSSCEYHSIIETIDRLGTISKASAAMFKLNIVRKVLNTDYDLHLTKNVADQDYTWYPCLRFITKGCIYYDSELENGILKKIGKIISEGIIYDVLSNCAIDSDNMGLGEFNPNCGVGYAYAVTGFLGCATKKIAEHFGEYFGMLIVEAMYGDIKNIQVEK